ncbi:MAG: low molecular weight protein-tyrosine-phosphatase [Robiginitomaculum sp.]
MPRDTAPNSVLFVCLGNICRSPTAEVVFRKFAKNAGLTLRIDSAGTGAWHQGEPPDPRAQATGERRSYSFAGQTARKIEKLDFGTFDLILAMDSTNLRDLKMSCPQAYRQKLKLFLSYGHADKTAGLTEVPDPYHGELNGFDHALDLLEIASAGLIASLT